MNDYRLLVFDWDGTLMDSAAHIVSCVRRAAEELGETPPSAEQVREIIGLSLSDAFRQLFPHCPTERAGELVLAYRRRHFQSAQASQQLFARAESVLQELRQAGYWLAVATGKSRRGLHEAMADSGTASLFFSTRTADDAASKPHPQMLLDILDELQVPAEQALMIGDTTYDMQMARGAGVDALAVSYGVHPLERLLACEPRGHIENIVELPAWLLKATN